MEQDAIESQLARLRAGDASAEDELVRLLYPELRALARRTRAAAGRHQDPGTGSLVHEACLKLLRGARRDWQSRKHVLSVAAKAMRQLLVDAARARLADKRGAGIEPLPLPSSHPAVPSRAEEVIIVDQALERLERLDPRLRGVVELRFFAGLSVKETAELLDVTPRTVNRLWLKARMLILEDIGRSPRS